MKLLFVPVQQGALLSCCRIVHSTTALLWWVIVIGHCRDYCGCHGTASAAGLGQTSRRGLRTKSSNSFPSDNMNSENATDHDRDNHGGSCHSVRSRHAASRESSSHEHKKNSWHKTQDEDEKDSGDESRSKTRTWHSDADRDHILDGEGRRSSGSPYSDDYENESDRSLSPYSRTRSPSPPPKREVQTKRNSCTPLSKTGRGGRQGLSRPLRHGGQPMIMQQRKGVRSQSKESTHAKDLDIMTKRLRSGRVLQINELRNALCELQRRTDELQKENRILRQLQFRQQKALQHYDDTKSEISQMLAHETRVLREQLRRTQERERTSERRLKDSGEQLLKNQTTIMRLKKLVSQRDLEVRDELNRRLEEETARAEEAERKVKDLERSIELSNSSFQRHLVAEKKKTVSAQEENRALEQELERLTNKLKERKRELDAKNIYANRMLRPSPKKDTDSNTKRKVNSRDTTKAVQTEYRASSLDFPTPPPAITDAGDYKEHGPDEYLSLKELDRVARQAETEDRIQKREQPKTRDKDKERDRKREKEKKQLLHQDHLDEKAKRQRDGKDLLNHNETENNRKRGLVQEEVERWNQEAQEANQQTAEGARHKKEQLLAKMREIDYQKQVTKASMYAESPDSNRSNSDHSSPRLSEQRNQNSSIFSLTAPEESAYLSAGDAEGGSVSTGTRRRALRTQIPSDDMAFGSYTPSVGNPSSRRSPGFFPPMTKEDGDSALEAIGVISLRGVETETDKDMVRGVGKDRKSDLMQQLFGTVATPTGDGVSTSIKMEVLSSPPPANGVRSRRDGRSGSSSPPTSSLSIHVTDSKPSVRAIISFDDDIEELAL
ncbi:hypothetical protein JOB18_020073 [Solea senegalensis]|uniref:Lebercilin domain-containing protein n=1 Tax=Solea senegalensis TaxID=28829 RepID=A0AAV6RVG7_SOLSE|nr:hypothetical protein JOB18_020073 [Solea senegalensis]